MGFFDFISDIPLVGDALGIVTGKAKSMSEQQQMAAYDYSKQLELMREQQDMQKDFADYQNRLQQETWNQQFTTQNQYNDPSQAAQRYLKAGISPSAAFGGSTVGQSSASIQASPVSGGSLPNASPVRSSIDYANAQNMQFATVAQALASIATAFKGSTEGVKAAKTINEEVEGLKLDNKLKGIQLQADQAYKVPTAKAAFNKVLQEANLLFQETENAQLDGLVKLEEKANKIQDRLYTMAKTEEQKTINNTLAEVIRQNISESKSRAYYNYKHGEEAAANAESVEFFNKLRVNAENENQEFTRQIKAVTDELEQKSKLTKHQAKAAKHAAEMAAKAKDYQEFLIWANQFHNIVGETIQGVEAFSRYGLVKKFMNSKPSSIESPRGFYLNSDGIIQKNPYFGAGSFR